MWVLMISLLLLTNPVEPLREQNPTQRITYAIRHVAPHVSLARARTYARIIRREASRKDIHPLLVVAFIQVETCRNWNPRLRSPTNDYGLVQVHVAERGSARFLGREEELFDPQTNIREWCRLAAMWRDYHVRSHDGDHPWWSHLKWGYRVKNTLHAMKVDSIYRHLRELFDPELEDS